MDTMDLFGYSKIEPYDRGFMPIGHGHKIYYEQVGNSDGYPIVFVHGGPGVACNENHRRFFDPAKWRVILFDQRGCGRSEPFGSLDYNTTGYLITDIVKLMNRLGISEAAFFAGSWGTTLTLAFALEFPERISAMILRGVYLANKDEMDYFYRNGETGIGIYQSEHWQRFIDFVPDRFRGDPLRYYYDEIRNGNKEAAIEIAGYNWSNGMMYLNSLDTGLGTTDDSCDETTLFVEASIAAHYFVNNCFLADGYILKNAFKLAHIPVSITQGRYDMVCQPRSAWLLHQALGVKSDFAFTLAGHASDDPENMKRLISETNRIYELVRK